MPDASYFAEKALRCRELAAEATNPHVVEQLRLWAEEFEAMGQVLGSHLPTAVPSPSSDIPEDPEQSILRPKSEGLA